MSMHSLHTLATMSPRVSIVGVSGFAGGELVRLLSTHPDVSIESIAGVVSAGSRLGEIHPWLAATELGSRKIVAPDAVGAPDVVVLALPHAESASLAPTFLERGSRVIDLSGAFRLDAAAYPAWYGFEHPEPSWIAKAVYGLPERARDRIAGAELVANPGCFATAAVLALAPLVDAMAIDPTAILVDGKTGVSGAGRAASETLSLAASAESVRPYRAPRHQHTPEIERALSTDDTDVGVTFVPHLVPAVRGVLVTCYAPLARGDATEDLTALLADAYAGEPFVRVLAPGEMADTKRVRGTNVVEVQAFVDERSSIAVAVAALDNLVKGASGQAVQNLNLMLGLEETTALLSTAVVP
jgi:N-acetyl-gamma-glutamyl-phosphate reductase